MDVFPQGLSIQNCPEVSSTQTFQEISSTSWIFAILLKGFFSAFLSCTPMISPGLSSSIPQSVQSFSSAAPPPVFTLPVTSALWWFSPLSISDPQSTASATSGPAPNCPTDTSTWGTRRGTAHTQDQPALVTLHLPSLSYTPTLTGRHLVSSSCALPRFHPSADLVILSPKDACHCLPQSHRQG